MSPLAFVAVPAAPPSLQGQRRNNPHSISKGGSTAKNLERTNNPHSISKGGSAAEISERTNNPHFISEGGSAAKILERTEKEGEVTINSPLDFCCHPHSSFYIKRST
jgi:hypothetical protein